MWKSTSSCSPPGGNLDRSPIFRALRPSPRPHRSRSLPGSSCPLLRRARVSHCCCSRTFRPPRCTAGPSGSTLWIGCPPCNAALGSSRNTERASSRIGSMRPSRSLSKRSLLLPTRSCHSRCRMRECPSRGPRSMSLQIPRWPPRRLGIAR